MRRLLIPLLTALALGVAACEAPPTAPQNVPWAGGSVTDERSSSEPARAAAAAPATVTPLLTVGDIAACDTDEDEKVAALAHRREGIIAIAGDAVYESGTLREYRQCFDPHWGEGGMYERLRPAPGNHDYKTEDAAGYFEYFAERIRRPGRGWYAFNIGPHWRGVVLNTNCSYVGCTKGSAQWRWLRRALADAEADRRHVIAFMHHPRFSSGEHGSNTFVRPLFRQLYLARAPLAIAGHDHVYERFAPQNARGRRRADGVRQFTVGTGGRYLYDFGPRLANTQVRNNTSFGLLKLRLRADGYRWRFIATDGGFDDRGGKKLPGP